MTKPPPLLLALLAGAPAHAAPNALQLDGGVIDLASDYLTLGALDPGTSFTVELWVRFDGANIDGLPGNELVPYDAFVEAIDAVGVNTFFLGYTTAWNATGEDINGSEGANCTEAIPSVCAGVAPAVGALHHVAVTVEPTLVRLFLDGVEIGSDVAAGPVVGFGTDLWLVGADDLTGASDPLDGTIDEVRVWNVPRDAAAIACTMDYTLTGDEPGLEALYSFDAGTAVSTPDSVGNYPDAVLMDDPAYVPSPFGLIASVGGDIPCFDFDEDGLSADDGDCDDLDPDRHPKLPEVAYDGIDNDCDPGTPDDDLDGDGFLGISDCDDEDAAVSPGATEIPYDDLDNDCEPFTLDDDLDLDGFGIDDDCDDEDADVSPGQPEVPYDGVDNDCESFTRDDDLDFDGFGVGDDCDDGDSDVSPAMTEVPYDGTDNDCDPATADDDLDADGFLGVDDCDDEDAGVAPGLAELCDGEDQDCDGLTDEGCPPTTGTDPTGTDPTGTDPTGTDPTGTDPTGTDPTGTDPTGTDPTGTPDDRVAPVIDSGLPDPDPLEPASCGCSATTGGTGAWLLAPLALLARRRRRG